MGIHRETEEVRTEKPGPPDRHEAAAGSFQRAARDLRLRMGSRSTFWIILDTVLAAASAAAGFWLSPSFTLASDPTGHALPEVVVPMYSFVFALLAMAFGMYERETSRKPGLALFRSTVIAATAWTFIVLVQYVAFYRPVGRWIVAISGLLSVLLASLPRMFLALVTRRSHLRIVIAGSDLAIGALQRAIRDDGGGLHRIVATYLTASSPGRPGVPQDRPSLVQVCGELAADIVVVEDARADVLLDQAVRCIERGLHVVDLTTFYEREFRKVPIESIGSSWLISADLDHRRPLAVAVKRTLDVLFASVALLVTLPVWPLIALLIKLTSRGPVFYRQLRVGQSGRPFRLLKFRSMRADAEAEGKAIWAAEKDPRVTWFGRLMRLTRIDELPQFINVLRGDMSFVGPRPERPEFVEELTRKIPHYRLRHLVKPGITGWAQITYPYGADLEDARNKLRYDLYYVKYTNSLFDITIMFRTIGAMVKGSR